MKPDRAVHILGKDADFVGFRTVCARGGVIWRVYAVFTDGYEREATSSADLYEVMQWEAKFYRLMSAL